MPNPPKAADIPDDRILSIVRDVLKERPYGVDRWSVAERLPEFPEKVVLAKLHALCRRKVLDGCWCGCRGDFVFGEEVTA